MPNAPLDESRPGAQLQRVAYVIGLDPSRKFGSLEEQILILARAFREQGGCFLPVFAGPLAGEAAREYAAAGITAEALDLQRFGIGSLRALLAILRRHRIELVHWSFYHPFNAYVWALSALRPRLRHCLTDHNSRYPQGDGTRTPRGARSAVKSALFGRYERVVCVSDFVADSLRREGVGAELTRCAHFVNTDRFRPDPSERDRVRGELHADEKFAVLLVAHLIAEKGAAVLLRAAAKLPPEIVVWVVGDGPEANRLHQLAKELSIEQRVLFLGDRGQVQPFMQAADCLACPSVWEEAAGLVNLEGLACGLPVVASRIGGIPEIVEEGRTGLLVTPGDPDALADAIHRLFKEPALRDRMGREARRTAVERFAAEKRIPDFLDLYRSRRGGSDGR